MLQDAVGEVMRYAPQFEGMDLLRQSLQKVYTRTLGERDYGIFEAVLLDLGLPLVTPLADIFTLNTSGARPLKAPQAIQEQGPDEPVTWDSKVDKFDKRLSLVRRQFGRGSKQQPGLELERAIRCTSMHEFYCNYSVRARRVQRGPERPASW